MQVSADTPFRVVILGDFSGRGFRGVCEVGNKLSKRPLLQIDRDKFDDVMARLNVHLEKVAVSSTNQPADLTFKSLDDFHPDRLFERWEMFAELRDLRSRLLDDTTYEEAAQHILAWGAALKEPTAGNASRSGPANASEPSRIVERADIDPADIQSLFEDVLEESAEQGRGASLNWDQAIYDIVAPYVTENKKPRQSELLKCVDAATQSLMTTLLHHPSFAALESGWRCLKFLVNRVESSPQLKIYLLDVTKEELVTDLANVDDLESSAFHRLITDQIPHLFDNDPVALMIGNYEFGTEQSEVAVLEKIAQVAAAAQTPFVAGLKNEVVIESTSDEDETEAVVQLASLNACEPWQALRSMNEAAFLGLTWPHFLLRTPYGAASRPIEAFEYEEIGVASASPPLLWGNSAFLCAVLLCESFSRNGWNMRGDEAKLIESLPTWVCEVDGETLIRAGGEHMLTERERGGLLAAGLIVVATVRDEDVVRISQLQSLHQPNLVGLWLT